MCNNTGNPSISAERKAGGSYLEIQKPRRSHRSMEWKVWTFEGWLTNNMVGVYIRTHHISLYIHERAYNKSTPEEEWRIKDNNRFRDMISIRKWYILYPIKFGITWLYSVKYKEQCFIIGRVNIGISRFKSGIIYLLSILV